MDQKQYLKNLEVPKRKVDVILDSDMFNEIDDQFALSYILRSKNKMNLLAIMAAPFLNEKSLSVLDGMEKSYNEIFKILDLALKENEPRPEVYKGSESWMVNDTTPVESEAAYKIIEYAHKYTPENPLYIIEIANPINLSSALLIDPSIKENIVIIFLGGDGFHHKDNYEFNVRQNMASARALFNSGAPIIQFPAKGVVSSFLTSRYELEHWFLNKNELSDYLARNTIEYCEAMHPNKPWSKPIWDVCAAAWLNNEDEKFFFERLVPSPIMNDDFTYSYDENRPLIKYVYFIKRDPLFLDLIEKITK